jgi:YbbR domain-containing protein
VKVTVDIEVRGQVRKVIPEVIGTDALAPGYELTRPPTVVPTDEVVVDGPSDLVAKVLYLSTEPIDISGWNESRVVSDVQLDLSQLPAGVTVDQQTVQVSIQIRKQTSQQQIGSIPITLVNAKPGTTATVSPGLATVTLEGSRSVIEGLSTADISVVVDLGAAGAGTYQLRPRVILPAGVQYRQLSPDRVTVTVTDTAPAPPTPTAVPTAAPTPTPQ